MVSPEFVYRYRAIKTYTGDFWGYIQQHFWFVDWFHQSKEDYDAGYNSADPGTPASNADPTDISLDGNLKLKR